MPSTVALIQCGDPLLAAPVAEVAGRRAAGIRHQDIRRAAGGQRLCPAIRRGDVGRDRGHRDAVRGSNRIAGRIQCLLIARHQHQVHAFGRQRFGAAAPQPLARAAYQRGLATYAQIHIVSSAFLFR
jgi:hypothetical protein